MKLANANSLVRCRTASEIEIHSAVDVRAMDREEEM